METASSDRNKKYIDFPLRKMLCSHNAGTGVWVRVPICVCLTGIHLCICLCAHTWVLCSISNACTCTWILGSVSKAPCPSCFGSSTAALSQLGIRRCASCELTRGLWSSKDGNDFCLRVVQCGLCLCRGHVGEGAERRSPSGKLRKSH